MAEYRLTGEAFAGAVVRADLTRLDTDGKKAKLRPWLTVATTDAVIVEPGAALACPDYPSQTAKVIHVTTVGDNDGGDHDSGDNDSSHGSHDSRDSHDDDAAALSRAAPSSPSSSAAGWGAPWPPRPGTTPALGDDVTYTHAQGRLPARAAVPEPGGNAVDPRRPAARVRARPTTTPRSTWS